MARAAIVLSQTSEERAVSQGCVRARRLTFSFIILGQTKDEVSERSCSSQERRVDFQAWGSMGLL